MRSEAIRRVKEAFDQAGIVMPEPVYRLRITDRVEAGKAGLLLCALEVRPASLDRLRTGAARWSMWGLIARSRSG